MQVQPRHPPPAGHAVSTWVASGAIEAALGDLDPLGLDELGQAALMDRIDRKFLVPVDRLPDVLASLEGHYRVFEIEGRRLSRYHTCYFDTPDFALYHAHHAGRLRRYKVRVRRYLDGEAGYIEVKFKDGRGRTLKDRIPLANDEPMAALARADLLGVSAAFPATGLRPSMEVDYSRITLVRRDVAERITLDLNLTFSRRGRTRAYPGVAVAEVKQAGRAGSPFIDAMRRLGLREGSLSKYCAGMASLEPTAKSNRFREQLRRLEALGAPIAANH